MTTKADREAEKATYRMASQIHCQANCAFEHVAYFSKAFEAHRLQSTAPLEEALREALAALEAADQFIENGIDLGYIRMPDEESNDLALETPSKVLCAIQKLAQIDALLKGKDYGG